MCWEVLDTQMVDEYKVGCYRADCLIFQTSLKFYTGLICCVIKQPSLFFLVYNGLKPRVFQIVFHVLVVRQRNSFRIL